MTRDEAIANAIKCADLAYDNGYEQGGLTAALARVGELWLGIADRLPMADVGPWPESSPPFSEALLAEVRDEDEEVVIATCGHRHGALLHRGRWLHPFTLDVCDDPPVRRAEK